MTEITTNKLLELSSDPNTWIIDTRRVESYNGWKLRNEPRGGHIRHARSLPSKWLQYIDWIEIVKSKQILPEHRIIVYGSRKEEIKAVAERFLESGYNDVHIYNDFEDGYLHDLSLPLQKLERYEKLIFPEWIQTLMSGGTPLNYNNHDFVIVHSHYRNREAYLSGHIPGAIDMDTLALESPDTWNRRSPGEIKKALEEHGITADTTVILYGKYMFPDNADEFPGSAAGDIGAIRNAFIMMYAGVKDVRILNGGFQSWKDAGFDVAYDDVSKRPVTNFGVTVPQNPKLAVDTPEAKEMIEAADAELVCVRSYREYIGEVSGYNYIEPKGRIPGAVFADCGSDAYHMENYRNNDHTTREFHETEETWRQNGITPDKHLAFYCGTGWRGSEAWFNAWLMGWPNISVYDGGWYEWSADEKNPTLTGVPEPQTNNATL